MAHNDNGRAGVRLLQFRVPGLPDLALAVALQETLEVTELGAITEVPFAPHFVAGLSEWRNRVVTVVDMADILCKDIHPHARGTAGAHYLVAQVIVGGQPDAVAWPISSGASMLSVPSQAPQASLSPDLLPQGIYAAIAISDTPLVLLNLASIAEYIATP